MKKITRNEDEVCVLAFVLPYTYSDTDSPKIEYKLNIDDTWVEKTTSIDSVECCGYVINLELDTSDMDAGSFYVKAVVNGLNTAIEEYVLYEEQTTDVSNYDGVKIIN